MLRTELYEGIRVDWDVPIPMGDGLTLRCDVFRPDDDRQYPVILGVTPYGKWLSFQDEVWGGQWKMLKVHEPQIETLSTNRFQNYEFPDPERFVRDGYVLVRIDARGTGRSPGYMNLFSARETQDFYDGIEWAGVQPWSNGRVGLSGVSYLACNQWQVSAMSPPHLRAVCIWEGASDFYREFARHGGILSQFNDLWFEKYVLPVQHGQGERGWISHITGDWVAGPETLSEAQLAKERSDWRQDLRIHTLATDPFWRERLPDFKAITVPLLSAANWGGQGLHLRGNIEGFLEAGSARKWLNFHCLEHWTEYYTQTGIDLQKRFFAHLLKDEDNGWGQEPKVQMLVRQPGKPFRARSATDWPLPDTCWTRLTLQTDGSLIHGTALPTSDTSLSFDAAGEGLTFLTAPLEHDWHVIGPSSLRMTISSSTQDADIFVVLRLFTPDLKEVTYSGSNDPHTPMSHGWLRASNRKLDPDRSLAYRPWHTFDAHEPLTPGQRYTLDIEILATCFVAPQGYRIGLSVRGCDYVYPGDLAVSTSQIGQPATGVGPFRHTCPIDRPDYRTANRVTVHWSGDSTPGLLVPVVPTD